MNILVVSNWSIDDGISRATILPLLEVMAQTQRTGQIVLCTVEPENFHVSPPFPNDRTIHIPFRIQGRTPLHKLWDLIRFPYLIRRIVEENSIDIVWCRGAAAGGLGALVNILWKTPFVVDSFEPHSAYMLDSGTWSHGSAKFLLQQWLEEKTKRRATALLPVSQHYYRQLLKEGVEDQRMVVLPCIANLGKFAFREDNRKIIRNELGIDDSCTVGIYVGKFGGLYYGEEVFKLYKALFNYFQNKFFLIVLTEMDRAEIIGKLYNHHVPIDRVFVSKVEHRIVAAYLSAADFAISTIKCVPAMQFCSPIKHGEYWAADLPILSTLSCGDDAEIMRKEGGGFFLNIFDPRPEVVFNTLRRSIQAGRTGLSAQLALRYRAPSILKDAVEFVLGKLVTIRNRDD